MLLHLTINNFVLVDELELDFHRAMNVITGETGAGKSVILNALGLTLGERGSPSLLRAKDKRAEINAVFTICDLPQVAAWLQARDLMRDDECILRRSLSGGGSRAFINGVPATLEDMKHLAQLLINLQSQHAHQLLMQRSTHRQFIDDFGDLGAQRAEYQRAYKNLFAIRQELERRRQAVGTDERMLSLLKHELAELEQSALAPAEYVKLEEQHNRLNNAESLSETVQQAIQVLDGEEGNVLRQLRQVQRNLQSANDRSLRELVKSLDQGYALIEAVREQLHAYAESMQADPKLFEQLDAQMSDLHRLARKHRVDPGQLEELKLKKKEELTELDQNEAKITELIAEEKKALEHCRALASDLTAKRKTAAARFDTQVGNRLAELEMECRFATRFTPARDLTEAGDAEVEFMLATATGADMLPLRRIASGGELSRVALAINLIAAQHSAIPCLVFDEVDSGIGGGVAAKVGKMLASLGDRTQVLCITHQAQIAVHADAHYAVAKMQRGKSTTSSIKILDAMERKAELGRMIGGTRLEEDARSYAGKLIEQVRPDVH